MQSTSCFNFRLFRSIHVYICFFIEFHPAIELHMEFPDCRLDMITAHVKNNNQSERKMDGRVREEDNIIAYGNVSKNDDDFYVNFCCCKQFSQRLKCSAFFPLSFSVFCVHIDFFRFCIDALCIDFIVFAFCFVDWQRNSIQFHGIGSYLRWIFQRIKHHLKMTL